jgi:hypothetical protein
MVGVDHAIVNGEYYVLECNGSAGLGSDFGLYNTTREDESYVGKAKDIGLRFLRIFLTIIKTTAYVRI